MLARRRGRAALQQPDALELRHGAPLTNRRRVELTEPTAEARDGGLGVVQPRVRAIALVVPDDDIVFDLGEGRRRRRLGDGLARFAVVQKPDVAGDAHLDLLTVDRYLQLRFAAIRGEQTEAGWGRQIRSYVLQPYQMVKDLRTELEIGNVNGVLDGDLDALIDSYLQWRRSELGE